MSMIHSQKFVKKYMRLAAFIAEENTACPSRKLGAIIVDPNHKIRGIGYNGPPAGSPHCNTLEYLLNVVEPLLTDDQRDSLKLAYGTVDDALSHCVGCPRKFLGYGPGEFPDMCSCQHAESNAIINAACDVSGCVMYCTLIPCVSCTGKIINARLAEVHYPAGQVYQPQVEYLFQATQIRRYAHT